MHNYNSMLGILPRIPSSFATIHVFFLELILFLISLITLPVYLLIDRPWFHIISTYAVRALRKQSPDHSYTYWEVEQENVLPECQDQWANNQMMLKDFKHASQLMPLFVKLYRNRPSLGIRMNNNEYEWTDFASVHSEVKRLASYLQQCLNVKPDQRVAVFMDTSPQWFVTLHALYACGAVPVTLYSTLGRDALLHALQQSQPVLIISQPTNMSMLKEIQTTLPWLNRVLCMQPITYEMPYGGQDVTGNEHPEFQTLHNWRISLYASDQEKDRLSAEKLKFNELTKPNLRVDSLALLMYTSGSTGLSKAVIITHSQLLTSMRLLSSRFLSAYPMTESETYIAYLPMAHILEFMCEFVFFGWGSKIAYGRPQTLFANPKQPDSEGDVKTARPTIIAAVPLILERIRSTLEMQISSKTGVWQFRLLEAIARYRDAWCSFGFQCSFTDRLFNPIRQQFGGRLRLIFSGGAPLAEDTQRFIQQFLGVQVLQGYASTECTAAGLIQDPLDRTCSMTGAPVPETFVRLDNWEEGNYKVTDKPFARGEIVLGSEAISAGYLDNPEETKNAFFEQDGKRWWKSGDIAEVDERGVFRIIDRKKDMIKLQFGEYISLGKIESGLKVHPLVDNIAAYGEKNDMVALVQPNVKELRAFAKRLGLDDADDIEWEQLCSNPNVTKAVQKELATFARTTSGGKLRGKEIPVAIFLCPQNWLTSGMVTAALKIRRKFIYDFYAKQIQTCYKQIES